MRVKIDNPATTTIAVKVSRKTARRLLIEANRNCRTRSGEARHLIEQALTVRDGGDRASA